MLVTHWADRPRSRSAEALGRFTPQALPIVRHAHAESPGGAAIDVRRVLNDSARYLGLPGRQR